MTPAGLEPAIPGSVGRCLIHWATGPVMCTDGVNTLSTSDPAALASVRRAIVAACLQLEQRVRINPATRNRTRDHLIAARVYSQMLYQLSYSRLVYCERRSGVWA